MREKEKELLDLVNYEIRYDFKNRLLLCLINNYYSRHYENNKNCKIVFISKYKSVLIEKYSIIYDMIKNFNVSDIYTLKKFYQGKFNEEKNVFTYLKEKDINYKTLIENIKNEYKENKSIYFNRLNDSKSIKENINIIFSTNFSMTDMSNKYLIKDIFMLDNLTKYTLEGSYDKSFIEGIYWLLKEYKKVQDIGNNLFNRNKRLVLNFYTNDNMDVVDYIDSELSTFIRDEEEYD